MASIFSVTKRCLSTSTTRNAVIKNVTVIGGGLMGSGIAQVAAQVGQNVNLVDVNSNVLEKAKENIATSLKRIAKKLHTDKPPDAEKFIQDSKTRINTTTDMLAAVKEADLVIEAVVENMEVKHKVFKAIDEAAPSKTIFASNTSSFSIGEISSVTKRQDRFGGLHFFHPAPVMKLLEVVRISQTSEETYQAMMEWGKAIGKVCVTCKDTPGFIVNRLLVPYGSEAVRLYESGAASIKDIDTAMKLGAGYPMGPFELADFSGLDISVAVLEGWHKKFPDNPVFVPTETVKKLVKEGKLGVKTGEGFYKYKK